jgi:hypothetical protein
LSRSNFGSAPAAAAAALQSLCGGAAVCLHIGCAKLRRSAQLESFQLWLGAGGGGAAR